MSEDITINKLTDSGKFVFVYSDKFNIFLFFVSKKDGNLYRVVLDKFFNILNIYPVSIGKDLKLNYENIKFFKPIRKGGEIVYIGTIEAEGGDEFLGTYKFQIEFDKLELGQFVEQDVNVDKQFRLLSCVDGLLIENYIQKANKLYFVGKARVAESYCDPVYGVVDISTDSIDNIYYLYSDKGNIELSSLNLDPEDFKVYVVGRIDILNKDEQVVDCVPYLESFTFFPA